MWNSDFGTGNKRYEDSQTEYFKRLDAELASKLAREQAAAAEKANQTAWAQSLFGGLAGSQYSDLLGEYTTQQSQSALAALAKGTGDIDGAYGRAADMADNGVFSDADIARIAGSAQVKVQDAARAAGERAASGAGLGGTGGANPFMAAAIGSHGATEAGKAFGEARTTTELKDADSRLAGLSALANVAATSAAQSRAVSEVSGRTNYGDGPANPLAGWAASQAAGAAGASGGGTVNVNGRQVSAAGYAANPGQYLR